MHLSILSKLLIAKLLQNAVSFVSLINVYWVLSFFKKCFCDSIAYNKNDLLIGITI